MLPGRCLPVITVLLLGAIAVPAQAATIQITMENLVFAPAEVSANIRQAEYSANGGTTPCGALAKPLWTFHVVVSSGERKISCLR